MSDLRARALAYLSRREYSRAELRRKLSRESVNPDQLDAALDHLERENFLSDARFAEQRIAQRSARFGTRRIIAELKQHVLDEAQLASLTAQLRDTELSRARAVWEKKFGSAPKTPAERAKQMRFLAMRGFDANTITQLFKSHLINQ